MADAFVRPAIASDAPQIAQIQIQTWNIAYLGHVPDTVLRASAASEELLSAQWRSAVVAPPTPAHRVLVAVEHTAQRADIVGFSASGPAGDDELPLPGAQTPLMVTTMLVEPRWGRRGHGSRLLAATVDLARDSHCDAALIWLLERDVASRNFFTSAGWSPDGTVRTLDMDGVLVEEKRYVTYF
ncbi:MAG: GNAT family N-acetyltransferase [Corynebacteriales bacterium]|nr:GNAT family N-acetyltransferase [Mycobacteriales bacterium]